MKRHRWLRLPGHRRRRRGRHAVRSRPTGQARIKLDPDRVVGEVHPHVFGNFVEHLGRCIYGGIFEEGSPLADADGFRKDVMDAAKGLGRDPPALAGRQLRLRLQLEGRHRPARPASGPPRPGLGRDREQPLRHRRVPELCREARGRALPLHQRRPGHGGGRPQLGRIHERGRRHRTGRSSGARTAATSPGTSRSGASATRSTGPGSSATRTRRTTPSSPWRRPRPCAARTTSIKLIASGSSQLRAGRGLGGLEPHGARPAQERDRLHLAPHLHRQPRAATSRSSWPSPATSTTASRW